MFSLFLKKYVNCNNIVWYALQSQEDSESQSTSFACLNATYDTETSELTSEVKEINECTVSEVEAEEQREIISIEVCSILYVFKRYTCTLNVYNAVQRFSVSRLQARVAGADPIRNILVFPSDT